MSVVLLASIVIGIQLPNQITSGIINSYAHMFRLWGTVTMSAVLVGRKRSRC